MSYTVKDKVYTEHPIMDEIVYNCKIILSSIVVKNDIYANSFETQESVDNAEYYALITEGKMQFAYCPFTYQSLKAYGCTPDEILSYTNDRYNIPESIRDDLVAFTCDYFMENFEEINDYYRSFMGLPPYNTTQFDVYLTEDNFPANYDTSTVDFSLPIHKQPINVISLLDSLGELTNIRNSYPNSFSYSYLRYLGDKKLDDYKMRKAEKWEILYMPFCEVLVKDRFTELFIYNRNIYLRRYYQEAFSVNNQHYENMMIINLLAQTFADMIVDVPEWYIRRDIFDARSVQYFLESYGVTYFKEIPLKYQIRIVKNINKLIKYKSSNKNNQDIVDIFGSSEANIFKYYLYKKRVVDPSTGKYIVSDDPSKEYELKFVKVKLGDNFDDYIRDNSYIYNYDELTLLDKWWDGEDEHETVKAEHLNRDFTIEGTKYMGLDYIISMNDYLFQLEYFIGMMLDSRTNYNFTDMKIAIPTIQESTLFNVTDLMVLLVALSYSFDDMDCKIRRPEDVEESTNSEDTFGLFGFYDSGDDADREDEYDRIISSEISPSEDTLSELSTNIDDRSVIYYSEMISREVLLDWMKPRYPEIFINPVHMEYGFNPNANLDTIRDVVGRRHSAYHFDRGYTLEELGVDTYIVPTEIKSIPQLVNIYKTNKKCYDTLKVKLMNAQTNDEYRIFEYVFNELFTKKFDYDLYKNNGYDLEYYTEVLKKRDYVLYTLYTTLNAEQNIETRKDNIRALITDIVGTLEYYISDDGLNYIFSFISSYTFQDLIKYIYLVIGFFKSYKVYFLDPQVTYKADGDYTIKARDAIKEIKEHWSRYDKLNTSDVAFIREFIGLFDQSLSGIVKEVVDIYSVFDPDPSDDYDYDGMYAGTDLEYKEADGGYADGSQSIPYIMLNAGSAQGGRLDLWDLNGSNAKDHINSLDVNGGYPLDLSDYRTDYFGKKFSYVIDGGGASTNTFATRTTRTRVIDRAIQTEIKISGVQYNAMVAKEDGIYLADLWTSWDDFSEVTSDQVSFMEDFSYRYENLSRKIELIEHPEMIDVWILRARDRYLDPMYKILEYEDDLSDVVEDLKDYTDEQIDKLWKEFYAMDPLSSWGNF